MAARWRELIRGLAVAASLAAPVSSQVLSPKVLRQGQPDATDLKAFAQTICARAGARTPRERAEAIWRFFLTDGRFVAPGFWYHIAGWAYEEPLGEVLDPLKLLNSYGFGLCYQLAPLLEAVWEAAGFEDARVWFLTGHTVAEVYYGGAYHHFDADMMGYTLAGGSVASVSQLAGDSRILLDNLRGPSFERGPREKHRIWYELLHGARGNLIWDEKAEHVQADGSVGPRGKEVEPYYRELRGGLGALLIQSRRQADRIAIHYSQASMRAEWMLAQRGQGEAWVQRTSATERMDSEFLRLRESYCRLVEDLGLQYNFVAYGQVEDGELARGGYRALILPRSSALSDRESKEITEFVRQGGLLIVDGEPGVFDGSVRKRPAPSLEEVIQSPDRGRVERMKALDYHQQRLTGREGPAREAMRRLLAAQGIAPEITVLDGAGQPASGVETHSFRNGGVRIVGLLTNPQLRVNELGPPEFKSNERFEKPRALKLVLPAPVHAYDLRRGRLLGWQREIEVALDPYEPALFALSPVEFAPLRVTAPERLARGEMAEVSVSAGDGTPAETHVFHVGVFDPAGKEALQYSGNVTAPGGRASKLLPSAVNDAAGCWTIRVRDALSGQERSAEIEFY